MDRLYKTEEALRKNGFDADAFNNREEAIKDLIRKLPDKTTIAFGGSMTLKEMDLYNILKKEGHDVKWHWIDEEDNLLHNVRSSKVYITSTNALTEDGKLVNMDGNGNRVASMAFGHDDVFIICGENKIVKDQGAAFERIREVAAPKRAKSLDLSTPCTISGYCEDCESPERICNVEMILHKKTGLTNIHILLIKEDMGF